MKKLTQKLTKLRDDFNLQREKNKLTQQLFRKVGEILDDVEKRKQYVNETDEERPAFGGYIGPNVAFGGFVERVLDEGPNGDSGRVNGRLIEETYLRLYKFFKYKSQVDGEYRKDYTPVCYVDKYDYYACKNGVKGALESSEIKILFPEAHDWNDMIDQYQMKRVALSIRHLDYENAIDFIDNLYNTINQSKQKGEYKENQADGREM